MSKMVKLEGLDPLEYIRNALSSNLSKGTLNNETPVMECIHEGLKIL